MGRQTRNREIGAQRHARGNLCALFLPFAIVLYALPAISQVLVLEGATLIDGNGGAPLERAVVVVDGEKIVAVGAASEVSYPSNAEVLSLEGQYLLPGLSDMHAHVARASGSQGGRAWSPRSEIALERALALGITTIRNPSGPTEAAVGLRDAVAAGEIPGPRIFTAGLLIDDPSSVNPNAIRVTTEKEIRAAVRVQAEAGVDYVKLYFFLPPQLARAAIDEAHLHGVQVIGHLARTSWTEAVHAGIDALTHIIPQNAALLPQGRREAFNEVRGSQAVYRWFEDVDLESPEIDELIDAMIESDVELDPTLVAWEGWFWADDPENSEHPIASFVPPGTVERTRRQNLRGWSEEDFRRAKATWPKVLAFAKLLHERGVLLLAGADRPSAQAVHHELELLVSAGIAPLDVLTIATRNAAEALGILEVSGTVEVGKQADLLVLDSDPLEDISHTTDVVHVVQAGRLLDLEQLRE